MLKDSSLKQQTLCVNLKTTDHRDQREPRKKNRCFQSYSLVLLKSAASEWDRKIWRALRWRNFRQSHSSYCDSCIVG